MSKINYLHLSFGDCLLDEDFNIPNNSQVDVYLNDKFLDYVTLKDTKKCISVPVN